MPVHAGNGPARAQERGARGRGCLEGSMSRPEALAFLQEVFRRYHHARFISPDPLELLYHYRDGFDREIVGLIASSLAYGRVGQIIKSSQAVLGRMGPSPRAFLEDTGERDLREIFRGFKHRFTTADELTDLLVGARAVIRRHGSLGACFLAGHSRQDDTTLPALAAFVRELDPQVRERASSLLPDPAKGSACKRLHLFLRWMVRSDEIDPGGWAGVPAAKLVVPLDTHMYRICSSLGMTSRAQADEKTAREITEGFRSVAPRDPVRYDFSLTRMGMRGEV
jgi:uncharacterized protein (TIGR02757 family)